MEDGDASEKAKFGTAAFLIELENTRSIKVGISLLIAFSCSHFIAILAYKSLTRLRRFLANTNVI